VAANPQAIAKVAIVSGGPASTGVARGVWYLTWASMLVISACNTLAFRPVFTGAMCLVFSLGLAAFAGMQAASRMSFLSKKESGLSFVALILFAVAQVVFWFGTFSVAPQPRGIDFSAYYVASKLISEKPVASPYDIPVYADGRMVFIGPDTKYPKPNSAAARYNAPYAIPFIYPPLFAVLMKPLAWGSARAGFIGWNVITVLLLGASVLLSLSLGGVRVSRSLLLIAGVGVFSYFPFQMDLVAGQIGCVIMALLALGVWLLRKEWVLLSALSFAAATVIKITPLLAVPILIFHRKWRWLAAYGLWMVVLSAFSVWQTGWYVQKQFWNEVLPAISCGSPICSNTSIVAFVQELFLGRVPTWNSIAVELPKHACMVSRMTALVIYLVMLVRFYRRRLLKELTNDLVVMSLLAIVLSPISWWHHYTMALLPFIYFWGKMPKSGDKALLSLFLIVGTNIVGFSVLLLQNYPAQLVGAAITPVLAIVLIWQHLSMRRTDIMIAGQE
jgi:hypothetical protein